MPPTESDAGDAALAREQGAEASALWAAGDFDAAHQTLQRLEATLPTDARVQLNLWVAGYYADAGSSLDTVAKELEAWLKAHSADPADVGQYNTHAVAAVNYGLILFLQQQHASALAVLEPLFGEVDLLQDGTALCLCSLLLEVYLDSCQLPKAVEVLQYLQGKCTQPQPPGADGPPGSPSVAAAAGAAARDAGGSSSSSPGRHPAVAADKGRSPSKASQQQQQQQQQDEGPAGGRAQGAGDGQQQGAVVPLSQALPVLSKTKGKRMQEVFQLVEQQGGKPSGQDLAPLLHLYKARLALACQNHKAAKKEVRGLLSCEPDSPAAVLLKAQLETSKQQPKKALKTLGPLLTGAHQHTIRCRLQLLNLLAAIHAQLDKHNLAALYLSTALELHAEAQEQQQPKPAASKPDPQHQRKQQGKRQQQKKQQGSTAAAAGAGEAAPAAAGAGVVARKSHWLLQDVSDALSYNMGLQQLALQDWQGAMDSFEAASSKFFTQPQVWLRWAEACLGAYHQQQRQEQQQLASQQGAAGAGPSSSAGGKGKAGAKQGKGQAGKKQQQQQQQQGSSPEQLLHQAAAHLSTGLVLLQEQQAAAAKQLEAATAAAAAATAAGEPPPDLAGQPWPVPLDPLTAPAVGADSLSTPPGGTAGAAASAAAGSSGAAGPSAAASTASVGSSTPGGQHNLPPDAALLAPELSAVRQGLLSNRAYVALQLGQPQEALEAAQALVACSRMSPQQHYLGSSYAAEALCMLGRVQEARQQLRAHMDLFAQHSSSGSTAGPGTGEAGSSSSAAQHLAAAAGAGPSSSEAAAADSTKSFDGSCVSCSKGVCGHAGHAGAAGAGGGLTTQDQASLLHNMGAVLMLQGEQEGAHRHAAMAAALRLADGQQEVDSLMRAFAAGQGL